jgi:hypothetical protein
MTTSTNHSAFADYDDDTLRDVAEQARLQLADAAPTWGAPPITIQAVYDTATAELARRHDHTSGHGDPS